MNTTQTPLDYLIIIQARIGSTRLPNKVMQMVGGRTILRRVWDAAKASRAKKVVVAWPERYPDLDETNVLERFRRVSKEFPSQFIIRLTSDCPLLEASDINDAIDMFKFYNRLDQTEYYSNHKDGYDVQIFTRAYLFDSRYTHREHVIADFKTAPTGLSVNTKEDLERVRQIAK
jgi:spore coat polysaccharide biosynthesis protein SpsF